MILVETAVSDVIEKCDFFDKNEPSAKRKCPDYNVEDNLNVEENLSHNNDVDCYSIDLTITELDEEDVAFNNKYVILWLSWIT
jgi:hypothetical protein